MPKADFLTGLVLLAVAALLVGEGVRLPGAGGLIMKGGEPGRVLIFLGLVIAAFAVVLIVRAVGQGGHRLGRRLALDAERKGAVVRAIAVAAGGTLYVSLLGRSFAGVALDYAWLTFGFVLAFIAIAEWKLAPEIAARRWQKLQSRAPGLAGGIASLFSFVPQRRAPHVWLLVTATAQAALIAVVVAYVFEKQFLVQLP
jgi:hypothetical protein